MLRGSRLLVLTLIIALVGLVAARLFGGALSGTGRFGRYGVYLSLDGAIRLAMVVALVSLGAESAWPFALALAISPLVAILPASLRLGPMMVRTWPGRSVARVVGGTRGFVGQFGLGSSTPIRSVAAHRGARRRNAQGRCRCLQRRTRAHTGPSSALFSPILIVLLPKLSTLAAEGRAALIPKTLARPLMAMVVFFLVGTVTTFVLGSTAMKIVYGDEYAIHSQAIGILTAGTGAYVIALTLAQGLIAMESVLQGNLELGDRPADTTHRRCVREPRRGRSHRGRLHGGGCGGCHRHGRAVACQGPFSGTQPRRVLTLDHVSWGPQAFSGHDPHEVGSLVHSQPASHEPKVKARG